MSVVSVTKAAGDTVTAAERNALREDILREAGDTLTDSGAADAYIVTCDNQITTLSAGQVVKFVPSAANTGAATLRFKNSLALDNTSAIKRFDGSALKRNDIRTQMITVIYDGTNWILVSGSRQGAYLLGFLSAAVTVTNTTTETTLLSLSVPANELGTENAVRGEIFITTSEGISNADLTLRLKLGSTTIATINVLNFGSSTKHTGKIFFNILANAATNAQRGFMECSLSRHSVTSIIDDASLDQFDLSETNGVSGAVLASGTAAEDTTSAKTLSITAQWSAASASNSITVDHGVTMMLKQ